MRAVLATIAALAMAGCFQEVDDPSVPAEADIARLEQMLAKHPCVGDLNLWERNYRFSRQTGVFSPYSLNPDFNIIEFHLRRAGTITIAPGRHVMPWREVGDWPDANTIQTLDGKFVIEGSSLEVARCRPVARG